MTRVAGIVTTLIALQRPDPVLATDAAKAPALCRGAIIRRRRRHSDENSGGWGIAWPAHGLGGEPLELSRSALYTIAFFALWIATTASSALTTLLPMSPFEFNRCPLPHDARP